MKKALRIALWIVIYLFLCGKSCQDDQDIAGKQAKEAETLKFGVLPVVQALARAVSAVHGRTAQPMGIGGNTVAGAFRELGLNAAVWSTICENAHSPNEFTLLSYLEADAKVLAHVFLGL